MIGLIIFGAIGIWLAASAWVAWRIARRTKRVWQRALIFALIAPLLVAAPLADEIVGKHQFAKYCERAKEVKIYGQIKVGEGLYSPDGRWRLHAERNMAQQERNTLNKKVQALIRWDLGSRVPPRVPAAIPIHEYVTRLFDANDGRLLAEWHEYINYGGWLKQAFGVGSATGGFLLQQRCAPLVVKENRIAQQVIFFDRTKEATK